MLCTDLDVSETEPGCEVTLSSGPAHDSNFHSSDSEPTHVESFSRRSRQVDDATFVSERATIVDTHTDALTGVDSRHFDPSAKRECAVGCRHLSGVESLPARSSMACQFAAVPGRIAHLNFDARCRVSSGGGRFARRLAGRRPLIHVRAAGEPAHEEKGRGGRAREHHANAR
jgi:hypothetical protein